MTERAPADNLFDWNYWLTTWPAEPVMLTRANAADGHPRALTPLSQDLIVRFEDVDVVTWLEGDGYTHRGASSPGTCRTGSSCAWGVT